MGLHRRYTFQWRRLHRPPVDGCCSCGPRTRIEGLSRGYSAAAQLARRPARLQKTRHTTLVFWSFGRCYGLYGQPLHRQPSTPLRRCLHTWWQSRYAPRPPYYCLLQDIKTALPRCAYSCRWHRGVAATPFALRLLGRHAETLNISRLRCRYSNIWHGRKAHSGYC